MTTTISPERFFSKQTVMIFLVPFAIVGTCFSFIGINHVIAHSKPVPIDFLYTVICAFVDMGVSAGIIALVLNSLIIRLRALFAKDQHPYQKNIVEGME